MTHPIHSADAERAAFESELHDKRPTCAVSGVIRRGAMCGKVIVGLKYCGYSGECEHKCVPPVFDHTKDAE